MAVIEDDLMITDFDVVEAVDFITVDAEEIVHSLVERFEMYLGETLHEGDERRIFLQGLAYILVNEANYINETGRSNLLKYATGNGIDAIAELYSNSRLKAEYATVDIAITISNGIGVDITIPKGTRVTPDGIYLFAIDEDVVFPANTQEITKTVSATAVEAGASYNGFLAGQISRIVDTNPYVKSISNTNTSSGGADVESDDEFKERLKSSPFSFAIAGPSEAYRSIAMSVSTEIGDVYVHSPSAGVVEIVVLLENGVIPQEDNELLNEILTTCSADEVRPLTDYVQVVPAEAVNTTIQLNYYVANNDTSVIAGIVEAIEEYKQWQISKIGRDINPDYLKKLLMDAGAARVEITSPVFASVDKKQVAQITDVSATYSGSISM